MRAPLEQFQLFPIRIPTPFPVGDVNVLLYKGGEALTLFDAAVNTEEAWTALLAGLKEQCVAVSDLQRVILTHHHFDHFGLLSRIAGAAEVEVCGHPDIPLQIQLGYDYDAGHAAYHSALLAEFGVPGEEIDGFLQRRELLRPFIDTCVLDRPLEDKAGIDGFVVHHVPGHSPTDTLFVRRQGDFAVTGDHILEAINPNPILRRPPPGAVRPKSLVQYQQSLRHTRSLEVDWCFPGHGVPIREHRRVVDGILTQHEKRNTRILAMMPPGGVTPFAAARFLYPRMTPEMLFFCLSVAAGQLEILEDRGVLESRRDQGVLRYFRAAGHEEKIP